MCRSKQYCGGPYCIVALLSSDNQLLLIELLNLKVLYTVFQKKTSPFLLFTITFPNVNEFKFTFGRNTAEGIQNKLTMAIFNIYSLCIASVCCNLTRTFL